ncbi:transcription factor bHLH96-like [Iris pallida]|uniref:Transcription factor bHLH96-like n=1 Tax=Iris pallida TaxID=29817 RepID=A0AAX6HQW7_IRIPA|nr:transcription factor bHLH96-like [Iris pallida]
MALEAVAFPLDLFGCAMKDLFSFGELGDWSSCGFGLEDQKFNYDGWDMSHRLPPSSTSVLPTIDATECGRAVKEEEEEKFSTAATAATATVGRRKKRRRSTRSCKSKDEAESQRMTHIAVERNRRKLMNEYLSVLRSIMPPSYVQRGDQASIVGGAINFVKELEQLLQSLDARRRLKLMADQHPAEGSSSSSTPFSDLFTYPSTSPPPPRRANGTTVSPTNSNVANHETTAKNRSAVADIEVTMVESHANLKVLSRQRPKQLLRMVVGLQNLRLTTLHLNVTTVHQMVLYSFSLKLEDDCHFTSVSDIATAVHHIVGKIQEEAGLV